MPQEAWGAQDRRNMRAFLNNNMEARASAMALTKQYFAWYESKDRVAFFLNAGATIFLLAVGMVVYVQSSSASDDNAISISWPGGGSFSIQTKSIGLMSIALGAGVLFVGSMVNKPSTDVVEQLVKSTMSSDELMRIAKEANAMGIGLPITSSLEVDGLPSQIRSGAKSTSAANEPPPAGSGG